MTQVDIATYSLSANLSSDGGLLRDHIEHRCWSTHLCTSGQICIRVHLEGKRSRIFSTNQAFSFPSRLRRLPSRAVFVRTDPSRLEQYHRLRTEFCSSVSECELGPYQTVNCPKRDL